MDTRNKIFTVIGTIAVLGTAGVIGAALFMNDSSDSDTASTTNSSQTTSSTNNTSSSSSNTSASNSTSSTSTGSSSTSSSSSYSDGTYTTTVSYSVPHGGQNTLKATVVVSAGKISSVTTDNNYTDHESAMYIEDFESAVSSSAVGQSISSYSPTRIGGASLTTAAFADAVTDIRSQAQS
jgi:hypothetical protein